MTPYAATEVPKPLIRGLISEAHTADDTPHAERQILFSQMLTGTKREYILKKTRVEQESGINSGLIRAGTHVGEVSSLAMDSDVLVLENDERALTEPNKIIIVRKPLPEAVEDVPFQSLENLEDAIEDLLKMGFHEESEESITSEFEEALTRLIETHGEAVLNILADQISQNKADPELLYQTLQVVGKMRHPKTHNYRLWLLQHSLKSSSVWIRDGAALGLSSLNDVRVLPFLKKALQVEPLPALRKYMERVISRLEKLL